MLRRLLLPIAVAFAIMTPVLAADPPTATEAQIKALQDQVALAKAQADLVTQQNAAAAARLAPLQPFAGNGTTTPGTNAGEMEAAYLATVAMEDVANTINRRVQNFVSHQPAPPSDNSVIEVLRNLGASGETPAQDDRAPGIIVLTDADTLNFDNLLAFQAESQGLRQAFLRALNLEPTAHCGDTGGNKLAAAALIPLAASVLGLLQSTTTVQGLHQLGDDGMLVAALAAIAPGRYIQRDALLTPPVVASNPVNLDLLEIEACERILGAQIPSDVAHQSDAQKAMQALVTRSIAFRARLTTGSATAPPPLAPILVQGELRRISIPYVLRLHITLSGGTMITRKNLWTALGAPAIAISGGVIARFRLTENSSGRSVLGGNVMCRTGLTGFRSAMALNHGDIRCAVTASPLLARDAEGHVLAARRTARLPYEPVFQAPEPVDDAADAP